MGGQGPPGGPQDQGTERLFLDMEIYSRPLLGHLLGTLGPNTDSPTGLSVQTSHPGTLFSTYTARPLVSVQVGSQVCTVCV